MGNVKNILAPKNKRDKLMSKLSGGKLSRIFACVELVNTEYPAIAINKHNTHEVLMNYDYNVDKWETALNRSIVGFFSAP